MSAAEKAAQILEGEMLRMTLAKPKSGNAQHLRAVSVVPLRTGFRPVIETLKQSMGWWLLPKIKERSEK